MPSILWSIPIALSTYVTVNWYLCHRRNLKSAQESGLPYVVVPLFFLNRLWLVTHPLWLPLLRRLPARYTGWVDYCLPEFAWEYRHDVFVRMGSDTFMTSSPGGNSLWTADPAVISQITQRRNEFPKPTEIYRSIDIYGKNVVSTEGAAWRHHRKSTSPPFTEKNNHIVWSESLDQAQAMLSAWTGEDDSGDKTVDRVMDDTMRLSLHVISRAGFGRKMVWPTANVKSKTDPDYVDPSKIKNETDDIDAGHTMSYTYSLHCLLDNILFQFLFPRWILKNAPFALLRKADEAFMEWGKYMSEMVSAKKLTFKSNTEEAPDSQMDILGQLVRSQLSIRDAKSSQPPLSDEEILGNAFVIILAGHETAANSIHFSILYLAMHLASQRRLQKDLDQIFQGRPPSEWNYDGDLPALFGGMAGAVLNEELRLVPPVVNIPKCTLKTSGPQTLMVDGKKCIIPPGCYISLAAASVHRNPRHWPLYPPTNPGGHPVHPRCNLDNDLEEFHPERWLLDANGRVPTDSSHATSADKSAGIPSETLSAASDGLNVSESSDTSDRLFRPVRGSYIPFSDGHRACLGRRFAQVEVLATLAVIFQKYSVELDVSKYATDTQLDSFDAAELAEVWQKAAEDSRDLMLNGCGMVITLQMRRGSVSVRFVKRGKERFPDDVDEIGVEERKKKFGHIVGDKGDPNWSCWRLGQVQDHIKL